MEKESHFARIYSEICLGYSENIWQNRAVYIKHLSNLDSIQIDSFYEIALEKTKSLGIKTYKEKLDWIVEKKLWNSDKDIEINKQKDYVESLQKTIEKLVFKSQKVQIEGTLKEEIDKLNLLLQEKEVLIGTTAEKIANQKVQFYCIHVSFFKDKELKNNFFTLEEINNLDDEESYQLLSFYIENLEKFSISNIKKIGISSFFTNIFFICGENLQSFFGKPVYLLTNYQSNLLSLGSYFKNLLSSNPNLPKDIVDDPEKIEEYIQKSRNFNEVLDKVDPNAKSVGIVANSQDFKEMGLKRDESFYKSAGPSAEK